MGDSKALLKARQKQCEDLFYEHDKIEINAKLKEKVSVRERFEKERERRELINKKSKETISSETLKTDLTFQTKAKKSRFDDSRETDNSQRRYLPKDDGIFSKNRPYDPDFGSNERYRDRSPVRKRNGHYGSY